MDPEWTGGFVLAGGVSLLAWWILHLLSPAPSIPWTRRMREAHGTMAEALALLGARWERVGLPADVGLDPNRTGLIGPDYSPLFTSLGNLQAKRTATNPDLAALMVHLLERSGVSAGDTVAVGASGSFPGLLIATLAAVRAVGAEPVSILSIGASSYGATRPDFHLLDIYDLLLSEGVFTNPPAAVSLGGEGDVGSNLEPDFRQGLREEFRRSGIPFLEEDDLGANVERRMAIYSGATAAFVNIGGSEANLGASPFVLELPPGLVEEVDQGSLPPREERGVLLEMVARGVPVIHLLHLRGLALRYGLPWDPVPLPGPGVTRFRGDDPGRGWAFWVLTLAYLGALSLISAWTLRRRRRGSRRIRG